MALLEVLEVVLEYVLQDGLEVLLQLMDLMEKLVRLVVNGQLLVETLPIVVEPLI
jgi:hypothetical protein